MAIDSEWRDEVIQAITGGHLVIAEYGLFNSHSSPVRDCLGDTLRMSIAMIGLDKVDNAQMIQVERTFLSQNSSQVLMNRLIYQKQNGLKALFTKVHEKPLRKFGKKPMTGTKFCSQAT